MISSELCPGDWVRLRDGRSAQIESGDDLNLRRVWTAAGGREAIWIWDVVSPELVLTPSQLAARDAGRTATGRNFAAEIVRAGRALGVEDDLVRQTAPGCWLVSDPGEPIPLGQTRASAAVAVYHVGRPGSRRTAWICERCGSRRGSTTLPCSHVTSVHAFMA
jgi:hypothetical protein